MGCNCKRGKGTINNLSNTDYITQAKETWNDVIVGKSEYNELEISIIYTTYSSLYPSSSVKPSLQEAINKIKEGIEIYDIKRQKRGR